MTGIFPMDLNLPPKVTPRAFARLLGIVDHRDNEDLCSRLERAKNLFA